MKFSKLSKKKRTINCSNWSISNNKFFQLSFLFFIVSCSVSDKTDDSPLSTYPQAKVVGLNLDERYSFNQHTGEKIKHHILESGDTLISGLSNPAIGVYINPDSVEKPKISVYKPAETSYNAHINIHKIPNKIVKTPLNVETQKKVILEKILQNGLSHYLLNRTGDTVKTGVPTPIISKTATFIQPHYTEAFPPRYANNTNTNIQYLDIDEGLISSRILCMLEDQFGNIWFGTNKGGMSKYDGKSFTHFTMEDGFFDNTVFSIAEDKNGNIWFGTYNSGICKYDGKSFTHFTEKDGLSHNSIRSILEDSKGNIWFGTWGSGVIKYDGNSFTNYSTKEGLSNDLVKSIIEDQFGNIWFGTLGGGACKFDGTAFTHYTTNEGLSNNSVWCMLEDDLGNIWFGTYGGGLNKYDGKSFTHFTTSEGLSNNTIFSLIQDDMSNIWIGTYRGGINKYDGNSFTHFNEDQGLTSDISHCMLQDRSGNIWFGTFGGGLNKFNDTYFSHFTEKEGLTNFRIESIIEDKKGNLWFGTWEYGLNKYDGKSFTHITTTEGLPGKSAWSMLEDRDGNIWIGTGNGVCKFDGISFTNYTTEQGLFHNMVNHILEDKKGNIWFATNGGGVSKYDGTSFTNFTINESLAPITVMLEDQQENIWFGTNGSGLCKFDGISFTNYTTAEGLSGNSLSDLFEDSNGNIWLAFMNEGLSIFDGENFTNLSTTEGLSNNNVTSINGDQNGRIWLSTTNGINLLSINNQNQQTGLIDDYTFRNFVKNDGLKSLEFDQTGYNGFIDTKNRIWWGSGKSLTMLDLNKYTTNANPPSIRLEHLEINETFIDYRNIPNSLENLFVFEKVKDYENYPLNLELPFDQNHLTFYFTGIDWSAPHKIKYSYLMKGLDSKWSQPSSEAKADYRNLPYGSYTFQVRAIGSSDQWSESFEYKFTIHPPFWNTWWARTLYALAGVLIFYVFIKWRIAKLKHRQKELETEVKIATNEIRNQKEQVEEAHTEITDSIKYAKRLQDAILPSLNEVNKYLPNNFILFKPKTVVSGDFYWFEERNGTTYIASADCTGHGVPGAMVSLVCSNALNRSVNEFGLTKPSEILDKTRELVIDTFTKSGEQVKDGMDIALCAFKGNKVIYSGANNPLWIVRKTDLLCEKHKLERSTIIQNRFSLIEYKANKQPIGLYTQMKPFTQEEIELYQGDSLYIFTDGFADQFGGEKGKKFKYKPFKNFLIDIQSKSMADQAKHISSTFENWRGNLEQIDDVCVIGVRI